MRKFILLLFILIHQLLPAQTLRKIINLQIYFDFDKDSLVLESKKKLAMVKRVKDTSLVLQEINIIAWCDQLGDLKYNKDLSERRAGSVKSYFLKLGVVDSIIHKSVGLGERNPKLKDTSDIVRMKDRVADVEIIYQQREIVKPIDIENKSALKKLDISKIEKGQSIVLSDILFIGGRSTLIPGAIQMLEELYSFLNENKSIRIEIQGHICCQKGRGDGPDSNTGRNNLSEARAKLVYDYLVNRGIDPDRLTYKGYGSNRKKYPETNPINEAKNRRVEILILEK